MARKSGGTRSAGGGVGCRGMGVVRGGEDRVEYVDCIESARKNSLIQLRDETDSHVQMVR